MRSSGRAKTAPSKGGWAKPKRSSSRSPSRSAGGRGEQTLKIILQDRTGGGNQLQFAGGRVGTPKSSTQRKRRPF